MTRPRIDESQKCICSRPLSSGRVYMGYHACRLCGLFIVVVKRAVARFRRAA